MSSYKEKKRNYREKLRIAEVKFEECEAEFEGERARLSSELARMIEEKNQVADLLQAETQDVISLCDAVRGLIESRAKVDGESAEKEREIKELKDEISELSKAKESGSEIGVDSKPSKVGAERMSRFNTKG